MELLIGKISFATKEGRKELVARKESLIEKDVAKERRKGVVDRRERSCWRNKMPDKKIVEREGSCSEWSGR